MSTGAGIHPITIENMSLIRITGEIGAVKVFLSVPLDIHYHKRSMTSVAFR